MQIDNLEFLLCASFCLLFFPYSIEVSISKFFSSFTFPTETFDCDPLSRYFAVLPLWQCFCCSFLFRLMLCFIYIPYWLLLIALYASPPCTLCPLLSLSRPLWCLFKGRVWLKRFETHYLSENVDFSYLFEFLLRVL